MFLVDITNQTYNCHQNLKITQIRIYFISNIDSELLEDKHDDETMSVDRKSHHFVFS